MYAVRVFLETERLVLREPTLADFADSYAMLSNEQVMRHVGGKPLTEEEAWARLHRHAGQWALLGFGIWVVRDRGGTYVGEVGFLELHRAVTPRLTSVEVGWMLAASAHGKGYATEAMRAALAWGDVHVRAAPLDPALVRGRFEAIIDAGNAPSIRVAEKLGFTRLGTGEYKGEQVVMFRRG
ncbi:MAG: GNAT family N-acetyltransferase [Myxococcales bacterium]|nr:GNAT family N-acetyltransferase [Myxococcales bacterium]